MPKARRTAIFTGIAVLVLIIGFLVSISVIHDWQRRRTGFTLNLKFSYLNNLSEGAPVMLAGGIKVGEVVKIYQQDLQTYVRIYIDRMLENRIPKRVESQFAIFSTSFAGQKYVNIFLPKAKPDDTFLQDGDSWVGINPPSIDQMLLAFSSWFEGKSGTEVIENIGKRATVLLSELNAIRRENREDMRVVVNKAKSSYARFSKGLDVLKKNFQVMRTNLGEANSKNQRHLQGVLDNINRITLNLTSLSKKLDLNKGSFKKLATSKTLAKNAKETIVHAKKFSECIQNTPMALVTKRSCG